MPSMEDAKAKLSALLRDEEEIQFAEFTNETALAIGLRFIDVAKEENLAITIDITRNGQQLFHYALPGTSADNDFWIQRKVRVVARFGHSSFYVGQMCQAQGTTFEEKSRLDRDLYAAAGGGFPVIVKNVGVVGTVTLSGIATGGRSRFGHPRAARIHPERRLRVSRRFSGCIVRFCDSSTASPPCEISNAFTIMASAIFASSIAR